MSVLYTPPRKIDIHQQLRRCLRDDVFTDADAPGDQNTSDAEAPGDQNTTDAEAPGEQNAADAEAPVATMSSRESSQSSTSRVEEQTLCFMV